MKSSVVAVAWRRARRLARRRWALAAALAASALAALAATARMRQPLDLAATADFPQVRPAHLAHLLADISAHTLSGPWSLEEESGNYTTWRYAVRYACGPRCEGRAVVEAHEAGGGGGAGAAGGQPPPHAPRHGLARAHRVLVRRTHCTSLPLLSWPQFCDELETESEVTGLGEGARLRETTRARCGSAAAALVAACPRRADHAAHAARRLQRLRARLQPAA